MANRFVAPLLLLIFSVAFSGCAGSQAHTLEPVHAVIAWDETVEDPSGGVNVTSMSAQQASFLARDGSRVQGTYINRTHPRMAFFVPHDGASTTRLDFDGDGRLSDYFWDVVGAEAIGHLLTGRPLRTGMGGEEFLGGQFVRWHVDSANQDELRLNVSYDPSAANYPVAVPGAFFLLTFRDQRPIPVRLEAHWDDARPYIYRASNFTVNPKDADPPPMVRALPPAQVARGSPFRLWENQTFSFEDAHAVWAESDRSRDAWQWVIDNAAIPAEVWYTVTDENDGNGTARWWHASYIDPESSQAVDFMVAWRVTHPTAETRRSYPFYDACPDGCVHDRSTRRTIGNVSLNGTLSPWPEAGVTLQSAVARLRAAGVGEPTAAYWRTVIEERRSGAQVVTFAPLVQPELVLSADYQRQNWDMDPGVPNLHGRLTYYGTSLHKKTTQDYATGNMSAVMLGGPSRGGI